MNTGTFPINCTCLLEDKQFSRAIINCVFSYRRHKSIGSLAAVMFSHRKSTCLSVQCNSRFPQFNTQTGSVIASATIEMLDPLQKKCNLRGPITKCNLCGPIMKCNLHGAITKCNLHGPITKCNLHGPIMKCNLHGPIMKCNLYGPITKCNLHGPITRERERNVLFNDALNTFLSTVIWHQTYG